MSGTRISKLSSLDATTIASNDKFVVVDVDDVSNSTGRTKNILYSELKLSLIEDVTVEINHEFVNDITASVLSTVDIDISNLSSSVSTDISNLSSSVSTDISNLSSSVNYRIDNLDLIAGGGGISSQQCFESTFEQTIFNLDPLVTISNTLVYVDGALLPSTDYSVTTNIVTLSSSFAESSSVCIIDFGQTSSVDFSSDDIINSSSLSGVTVSDALDILSASIASLPAGYVSRSIILIEDGLPISGSILFKAD